MDNKTKALKVLDKMNKSADNVYDGLTSNAPALQPASNIVDTYRAVEAADIRDYKEKVFLDNLELSRRLMEIDNAYYNVLDDVKHELLDYIEQQDFDVLQELEMEFSIKKKELKNKAQEISALDIEDYLTEEDYKRVVAYKARQIRIYQSRLEYLAMIIKTIKEFMEELKSEEDVPRDSIFRNNMFDFVFTNENANLADAGRMR